MRTNIVIDDELMEAALKATGVKTKRGAVELGVRTLLRRRQQTEVRKASRQAPVGGRPGCHEPGRVMLQRRA